MRGGSKRRKEDKEKGWRREEGRSEELWSEEEMEYTEEERDEYEEEGREFEGSEEIHLERKSIDELPQSIKRLVREANGEKYILINDLNLLPMSELVNISRLLFISDAGFTKKQELTMKISKILSKVYGVSIWAEGVFEIVDKRYGFLRFLYNNYSQSSDDVYVDLRKISKRFNLKKGDTILGVVKPPEDGEAEKYFSLEDVKLINYDDVSKSYERTLFENLTPYYPTKKFDLDISFDGDISPRVVDIIAPIGKGQRGLVVSPPRAGKTMLLQNIAKSILTNHPEVFMIILLIDERPEEVTDWRRNIVGKFGGNSFVEVVASTFDETPKNHIHCAEVVLEKAKRLAECGRDVVILLDSITRLTRAQNQLVTSSGKVLTGGIDSTAFQFPKRFFGAARSLEESGSLTIIATCLIETGSKMDEVIFEEFKGTGNMEIYLSRTIAERRIFPAIDVHRSGTRKEELLFDQYTLERVRLLRRVLEPLTAVEAMELLYEKMKGSKNHEEFFSLMSKSD